MDKAADGFLKQAVNNMPIILDMTNLVKPNK